MIDWANVFTRSLPYTAFLEAHATSEHASDGMPAIRASR